MKDESEVVFGPWWIVVLSLIGTAGWLMVYRLWTSQSKVELDKMTAKLAQANATIERLETLEKTLTKSNLKLHDEHTAMRDNYKELTASYARLAEDFAKLQKEMKAERAIRMEQFGELMKYRIQDPNQ